jgi:hypothetical protein
MQDVGIPQILSKGFSPELVMQAMGYAGVSRQVRQQYVYFLRRPDGHIKIGCTQDVESRKKVISNIAGYELELLGFIKGGYSFESCLHDEFADIRTVGEWFSQSEKLNSRIASLLENERVIRSAEMQPLLFQGS